MRGWAVLLFPLFVFVLAASDQADPERDAAKSPGGNTPSVETIIQRSVEALRVDWKAAPEYNYYERDLEGGAAKTYQVIMMFGSPYKRLVNVNGKPLSKELQSQEQQKLNQEVAKRQNESAEDRARRVAQYEKERTRDNRMIEELTRAFNFKLIGTRRVNGYRVYFLEATPRAGYQPPNVQTEVLTGMQGKLWIDVNTFEWVKVQAEVIHPVSIEGFLAQVEPGTHFELERAPASGGVWLNTHFEMRANTKILFFVSHKTQEEETYFGYEKATQYRAGLKKK